MAVGSLWVFSKEDSQRIFVLEFDKSFNDLRKIYGKNSIEAKGL